MHSCIFEGLVSHSRFEPVEHRFQYRLFMLFLDLAEIPELVGRGRMISDRPLGLCAFQASDHLAGMGDLENEVRTLVEQHSTVRPQGRICLLTQLRHLGYYFSPLNLFYIYSADDGQVESVVAEVNNTPWGERHCYVLWHGNQTDPNSLKYQHPKQLHVSPFMDMEMSYSWRFQQPGDRLSVLLENLQAQRRLFAASLNLRRVELNRNQLRWMLLRYPLMTLQIIAAIHYQALKLWWKKCPVYPHPNKIQSLIQSSVRNR